MTLIQKFDRMDKVVAVVLSSFVSAACAVLVTLCSFPQEASAMKLTTEDQEKIMVEMMTGKEATIHGAEADKFREELKKEINFANRAGYRIDIQSAWNVGTEDDKGG